MGTRACLVLFIALAELWSAASPAAAAKPFVAQVAPQVLLDRATKFMDKVRTMHAEGSVAEVHGRLSSNLRISGDCDASTATNTKRSSASIKARSWLRGFTPRAGHRVYYSGHFVVIGSRLASGLRSWERSYITHYKWQKRPYFQSGVVSQASEMCSPLFLRSLLLPASNSLLIYSNLGKTSVGSASAEKVEMEMNGRGGWFGYDWYIDESSDCLLRMEQWQGVFGSSELWTFNYSRFGEKLNIQPPR